jgi:hypothetical protein
MADDAQSRIDDLWEMTRATVGLPPRVIVANSDEPVDLTNVTSLARKRAERRLGFKF